MRAIDADAFDERVRAAGGMSEEELTDDFKDGVLTTLELLKTQPTIQPKRGRWIYCEDTTADCVDGYRCDQCGLFVPWDYQHKGIDFIQDYNFCPHCGSDMREVTG